MKTIVELVEELKEYSLEKDTAAKQAVEANIAPVEADPSSASRAYEVGEQLILNDVLYDVTSSISVEDAIVVGTNITAANKLSANIKSITNQANDMVNVLGAKNIIPLSVETQTINGVTLTVQDEGSIILNGTATANAYLGITKNGIPFKSGKCILSGVNGGSLSSYCLFTATSGGATLYQEIDGQRTAIRSMNGDSAIFDINKMNTTSGSSYVDPSEINIWLLIANGYTFDNVLIKPMVRLASITDDTYEPFAKTNQELTAENQTLTNQVKDMNNVLGAKNLLPISLNYLKSINTNGTWNGNAYTVDNVTYTVNTDSQGNIANITTSGTASTNSAMNIYGTDTSYGKNNFSGMILNGCPSGGGTADTDYRIVAFVGNSQNGTGHSTINDTGDGATLTNASYLRIYLRIPNGYSSSLVFKPMIRPASITDDTYEPYAMTNKELTDLVNSSDSLNDITQISVVDSSVLEIISCNLSRKGNVLYGQVVIKCKTDLPFGTSLFILPAAFRPIGFINLIGMENTTSDPVMSMFGLWPSGSVQIVSGTAPATKTIRINIIGAL